MGLVPPSQGAKSWNPGGIAMRNAWLSLQGYGALLPMSMISGMLPTGGARGHYNCAWALKIFELFVKLERDEKNSKVNAVKLYVQIAFGIWPSFGLD